MAHSRNQFLFIAAFSFSFILAQTEWTRYEANPVLVPGGLGETTTVVDAKVVRVDTLYHLWYAASDQPDGWNPQIYYASSFDGLNWIKVGDGPVLPRGADMDWDVRSAFAPDVMIEDSLFKMWYSGRGLDYMHHIGYALSNDGITWEKFNQNPILSDSGSIYSAQGLIQPCVLKIDDVYHMWYAGHDGNTPPFTSIFYATSLDGVIWYPYDENPVLLPGENNEYDSFACKRPNVLVINGKFHMWYLAWDGIRQTIGYATSPDGINWTKWPDNPVMVAGTTTWELEQIAPCDIHYTPDGTLRMWYEAGTLYNKSIGFATSQFTPFLPGDRTLLISPITWVAGDTVQVPVLLSESYDVAGIDFTLSYDTDVLTFAGIDTTALTSNFLLVSNETAPGTLAVAMAAPWPLAISGEAGEVAVMDFVIAPDATVGTVTPVHFLSAALADTAGNALGLSLQDGSVRVTRPGDLNFDGLISSADAVVTLRISIGAHDPTPQQFAMADRDSNGVVEEIDALCLLQTAVGLGCNLEGGDSELLMFILHDRISGTQGTEVVIPIQLSSADQLAAGSLELALPADLVTAVNVTSGDLLSEGYTAWYRADDTLRVGFLTAEGLPQADGILLNLHLTLSSDLVDYELEFVSMRPFDSRGRAMNYDFLPCAVDEGATMPGQCFLSPAWPNPFNPATTIRYRLPAAVPVRLLVYDLLGREITRLVETEQAPGTYEIRWDGTDASGRALGSGIYIARLATPQFSQAIKLVLLK